MDDNISYNPYKQAVRWGNCSLRHLFPSSGKGSVYSLEFDDRRLAIEVIRDDKKFLVFFLGRAAYAPVGGALSGPVVDKYIFSSKSEYDDVVDKIDIGLKFLGKSKGLDVEFIEGLADKVEFKL